MTFSIVARCPRTGRFGVAAATGANAVGQLVSHARAHIGAVATQAWTNPYIGYDGLRLLEHGYDAPTSLEMLINNDPNPQIRQAAIIDRWGNTAAWTGNETLDWKGDRQGRNFSTQGNRLAGPQVLDAVVEACTPAKTRSSRSACSSQSKSVTHWAATRKTNAPRIFLFLIVRNTRSGTSASTIMTVQSRNCDASFNCSGMNGCRTWKT